MFRIIICSQKIGSFQNLVSLCWRVDVLMFTIFKQYLGFYRNNKVNINTSTQITILTKNLIFSNANIILNSPNWWLVINVLKTAEKVLNFCSTKFAQDPYSFKNITTIAPIARRANQFYFSIMCKSNFSINFDLWWIIWRNKILNTTFFWLKINTTFQHYIMIF